jgi:hypothetical protein
VQPSSLPLLVAVQVRRKDVREIERLEKEAVRVFKRCFGYNYVVNSCCYRPTQNGASGWSSIPAMTILAKLQQWRANNSRVAGGLESRTKRGVVTYAVISHHCC